MTPSPHAPVLPSPEEDPIARAERALAGLSEQFSEWMSLEIERLDAAWTAAQASNLAATERDTLFRAAHDIKGEAATFGFPAVGAAAESLCRLLSCHAAATALPVLLVGQHVDSIRAIVRETIQHRGSATAGKLARDLTERLREATDHFIERHS